MADVGRTFGGYRLDGVLGTGGMGVVYRATDLEVGRTVAVKIIPGERAADPTLRARFEREWRAAAALDHPHVVPLYAAGEIDGALYMAMRHVVGGDLGALLAREGRLPLDRALRIVEQVASALDAAHAAGLVHRDVKPSNVLLDTGTADHAYLTDFGVVQLERSSPRLTRAGALVGTVDYAAPEQLAGDEVGPAADVYALGAVLHELLVGRRPYDGATEAEILRARFEGPPAPLGIAPELDAAVARAMAHRPEDRYATAGRFAQDLRARADRGTRADVVEPQRPAARPSARKIVTVVALAVSAATEAGERTDPEAMRPALERARQEGERALCRHGGDVLDVTGGGLTLAAFGASASHEDDALRAVRAGLEAVGVLDGAEAEPSGVRLRAQIGVATAEAVVSTGGDRTALDGDVVGTALRLAATAPGAGVLVDAGTEVLVRAAVVAEPAAGGSTLVREVRADADPRTTGREAPLVGRQAELGHLEHVFERVVAERRSALVTILGPPGIGKSRLRRELTARVEPRAQVLVGRCLPYGDDITFWPLAEIVRAASGGGDVDLAEIVDDPVVVERLAGALGLAPAGAGEETAWAARKLFEALARTRPTVLVFEDVHWAEPAMLDLIEHVADWARDVPLLLVCLARLDLVSTREAWGGGLLNASTLALEPLTTAQSEAVLDTLADRAGLDPEARSAAVAAAEGNPLFLEHMAVLLEAGVPTQAIPPTIQAVLAARLDELEPAEREVLAHGAVIGREFWRGALTELTGVPVAEDTLRRLQRRDLIRSVSSSIPGEDAYAFRHILLRDVAYGSLPKAVRAEAHERFAAWLEQAAAERLVELEEILGYHVEVAAGYRRELGSVDEASLARAQRGAERLAAAGRRALARDDHRAGVGLLSRALALAGDTDGRIAIDLCAAHVDAREHDEALAIVAAHGDDGTPWRRARLAVERAYVQVQVRPAQAVADVERAEREAQLFVEEADDEGLARLALVRGERYMLEGRTIEASAALHVGLETARRVGNVRLQERLVFALGTSLYNGAARLDDIADFAREWLEWARENGALTLEARLLQGLGATQGRLGRFEEARALLAEAAERQRDLGLPFDLADVSRARGMLDLISGDAEGAARHLGEASEQLRALGDPVHRPTVDAEAAIAHLRLGHDAQARALIEASRAAAAEDDVSSQVTWRVALSGLRLRAGAVDEALALAHDASARAGASDSTMMRVDALVVLARTTARAGRREEARALADEARRLADGKGYVPGVAAATALAAAL